MTPQELDLMSLLRVRSGDIHGLSELYDRYAVLLHSVASAVDRKSPPEDVDEVIRDVFRRVWTRAVTYDRRSGSAALWLVLLARDRALERRRAHAPASEAERLVLSTLRGPAEASLLSSPEVLASAEARELLSRLAPLERMALAAAMFEKLPFFAIAERLEVPVDSAKRWIRQALTRLNQLLTADQWT